MSDWWYYDFLPVSVDPMGIVNDGTIISRGEWFMYGNILTKVHLVLQILLAALALLQLFHLGLRLRLVKTKRRRATICLTMLIICLIIAYSMTAILQINFDDDAVFNQPPTPQNNAATVRLAFYLGTDTFLLAAAFSLVVPSGAHTLPALYHSGILLHFASVIASAIAGRKSHLHVFYSQWGIPWLFYICFYLCQGVFGLLAIILAYFICFKFKSLPDQIDQPRSLQTLRYLFVPCLIIRLLLNTAMALVGRFGDWSTSLDLYHRLLVAWDAVSGVALVVMIYVLISLYQVPKSHSDPPTLPPKDQQATEHSEASSSTTPTPSHRINASLSPSPSSPPLLLPRDTASPSHPAAEGSQDARSNHYEGMVHMEKTTRAQKLKDELLAGGANPTRPPDYVEPPPVYEE